MMIIVTKEIVPFLVVYITGIIYFSVLFIRSEGYGEELFSGNEDYPTLISPLKIFFTMWNLPLGYMEYKIKFTFGACLYFVCTLLQSIVQLNVLISVIGDSFDKVMVHKPRIEMQLKASLLYELALSPFLRQTDLSKYFNLYVVRSIENKEEEWTGRIDQTNKEIKKVGEKIDGVKAEMHKQISAANDKIKSEITSVKSEIKD